MHWNFTNSTKLKQKMKLHGNNLEYKQHKKAKSLLNFASSNNCYFVLAQWFNAKIYRFLLKIAIWKLFLTCLHTIYVNEINIYEIWRRIQWEKIFAKMIKHYLHGNFAFCRNIEAEMMEQMEKYFVDISADALIYLIHAFLEFSLHFLWLLY